jgi:diguanylate cyclase (GGDEF)-like protein
MLNTKYIVLVDDTKELCELVAELYENEIDYEFVYSNSDKTSLRNALLSVPDLIVINEDGLEDETTSNVCKYIRKGKDNTITPIIVTSSQKDENHRLDILKKGVEYYIPKPLNKQYFYYTIRNLSHLISSNRCISELTGLPGNLQIENELKRRIGSKGMYAVLYTDLDNFKAYNDKYGFMNGDEVIKYTAEVLKDAIQEHGKRGDFLGHIGGDDFVAIVNYENAKKIGRTVVKAFDKGIKEYYSEEDIKKGGVRLLNRKGKMEKYPITTITVAMISNRYKQYKSPLEIGEDGAAVKKKAKAIPGSTFLEDRRKS